MTRSFAASDVRSAALAISVAGARQTGIERGEHAQTLDPACSPATWVYHRAVHVERARLGAACAFAALVAGKTVDDGFRARAVEASIGNAGIVLLFASAVAMVLTRLEADATDADFVFGASIRAGVLSGGAPRRPRCRERQRRCHHGTQQSAAVIGRGEPSRQVIEAN